VPEQAGIERRDGGRGRVAALAIDEHDGVGGHGSERYYDATRVEAGTLRTNPLLASRDGLLFLASQALDATSNGIAGVALPWLVLDATGSKSIAGLILAIEIMPYVVFGLPAGVVGDRFSRRTVIASGHALQTALAAVIPVWAALDGTPPLAVIVGVAFAIGSLRAFVDAAAFGAVAAVVGPRHFTGGQAVLSASWSLGLLTGPSLGGALIGFVGPSRTIAVQAAAFALATVAILLVRSDLGGGRTTHAGRIRDGVTEGVRYLLGDPLLRVLTATGVLWNIASAGSIALIVPLLRRDIGLGSEQAGIVLAVGAAMGLVSAPLVHALQRRVHGWRLYLVLVFASAPATAALGLAYGFAAALAANASASLVNWLVMNVFIGERQRRAPAHLQARVGISGRMVMTFSMTVGALAASAAAHEVSLRVVYVAMGVSTLLVGLAATPAVRRAAAHVPVAGD
jgi:MFS family permease